MKTNTIKRTRAVLLLSLAIVLIGILDFVGGAILLALDLVPDTPLFHSIFSMGVYIIILGLTLLFGLTLYNIHKKSHLNWKSFALVPGVIGTFFMTIMKPSPLPEELKQSFTRNFSSDSSDDEDFDLFDSSDDDNNGIWSGDPNSTWSEDETLSAGIGSYQWWDRHG